jgi:hypothetical protein
MNNSAGFKMGNELKHSFCYRTGRWKGKPKDVDESHHGYLRILSCIFISCQVSFSFRLPPFSRQEPEFLRYHRNEYLLGNKNATFNAFLSVSYDLLRKT